MSTLDTAPYMPGSAANLPNVGPGLAKISNTLNDVFLGGGTQILANHATSTTQRGASFLGNHTLLWYLENGSLLLAGLALIGLGFAGMEFMK